MITALVEYEDSGVIAVARYAVEREKQAAQKFETEAIKDISIFFTEKAASYIPVLNTILAAKSIVEVSDHPQGRTDGDHRPVRHWKSTLLKLLLGLYRPDPGSLSIEMPDGSIAIDRSTRSLFSYAPQGNFLLSGTLRENLTYTNPQASDEQLDERSVIRDICEQENIQCRYLRFSDGRSTTDTYERVIPPFVNTFELSYGSRWMHEQGAQAVFTGHGGDEGISHRGGRYELLCNGELLPYLQLHYRDLEGISLRPLKTLYAASLGAVHDRKKYHKTIKKEELVSPVLCKSFTARMAATFREQPFHFFTKPYRYVLQGGTRDRLENAAFQGASAGVRYLFPFVDYRVMDFAVSIPRHLYVSNGETRVLYRNAFADLMPDSLRRVSYKAMVSLRHIKSRNMDSDAYVINRGYIVNKLDPEYWRGILDLEAIARREQPQDPESAEARAFRSDTHMLYHCILIQNTAKQAKDWRTIHDRTDLL